MGSGGGLYWSVRDSCRVVDGLKSRGFRAACLSACRFSSLYDALPHSLVADELVGLVGKVFQG